MDVYYINSISGSDENTGESQDSALKTLQFLLDSITKFKRDTTIYLRYGEYSCDDSIVTKIPTNVTVNVVGSRYNTTLKPTMAFGCTNVTIGVIGAVLNINRLIFDMTSMTDYKGSNLNTNQMINEFNLNNVVLINAIGLSRANFISISHYTFRNCIATSNIKLRTSNGKIHLYNCYGFFSNGSKTIMSDWDISDNVITVSPQLNEVYEVMDSNVSDNVGVYYGDYAWLESLLKYNNQYYSIRLEHYNINTQQYNPLETVNFNNDGFDLNDLFKETTINEETFNPIDKFDNFTIISKIPNSPEIQAIKSDRELIVASGDIKISIAHNIEYLKLNTSTSNNGDIKIVFSTDKGNTWFTHSGEAQIPIDCVIPMKDYQVMTYEEKILYNMSKDEIFENGMDIDTFNSIDFNTIDSDNIRFAYALFVPTYNDVAEVDELIWKFDAKGYIKELKDNEYDLDVYDHRVQLKSNITNNIVKLSVIT